MGRGSNYQGLWEGEFKPPKEFRIKDSFLEYLRKNIENSNILDFEIDEGDRVIYIPYYKGNKVNCFSFFWKGKDLVFSNLYSEKGNYYVFNSWIGKNQKIEGFRLFEFKDLFDFMKDNLNCFGRRVLSITKKVSVNNLKKEKTLNSYFNKDNKSLYKKLKGKRIKFLERKKEKIEIDIKKMEGLKLIEKKLSKLELNLENKEYHLVCGKKVKFGKEWSTFKKRSALFEKIKNLKKGLEILKSRKVECEADILKFNLNSDNNEIDINKIKVIKPFWKIESKSLKTFNKKSDLGYEEYILDEKIKLGIGLNSSGNDNLRKFFGKKNDFWFHLDNYKSCHCIVKIESISDITSKYFELIGSAIRDKSNLLIEVIPLVFTQVKNLKGVKGRPGTVTLKNEKYRDVRYNRDWREIISKN